MKNVQIFTIFLLTGLLNLVSFSLWAANPLFTDVRTADPAALVVEDTVYLYTGHDEAKDNNSFFMMHDWLVFSSKDMKTGRLMALNSKPKISAGPKAMPGPLR